MEKRPLGGAPFKSLIVPQKINLSLSHTHTGKDIKTIHPSDLDYLVHNNCRIDKIGISLNQYIWI